MPNGSALQDNLKAILESLNITEREVGFIYSNNRESTSLPYSVTSAFPDAKNRYNHIASGLLCVYPFAIIEEFICPQSSNWQDFLKLLDDKEKFMAYKHIRNTFAHGFDGMRADRNVTDFDSVMARSEVGKRIPGIQSFDSNQIILADNCGIECYAFVIDQVRKAYGIESNN